VTGEAPRLGEPLLDEYLRFVAARARPNTVLAQSYDLKVFFTVVAAASNQVSTADVLRFIEAQRKPRGTAMWSSWLMANLGRRR
jgi:integrase/recombinase XerD